MHAIKVLHNLLAVAVPSIHKTRLQSFIASIESVASGAALNVTAIGRGLSGTTYDKHKIKRADRLLSSPHLYRERHLIYRALIHRTLSGATDPIIIIDWSPLCGDLSHQLLRASVPIGKRSITLYEEVHPEKKLGNRRVQHRFLDTLASLLPANTCPTIVADSGFRTPFYRYVEERLGWGWVGRIRGRDFICPENNGDQWVSVKTLFALANTRAKDFGLVKWVRSRPLTACVTVIRQPKKYRKKLTVRGKVARSRRSAVNRKRNKEPWVIVYSRSLRDRPVIGIIGIYKKRMQIEQGFRDSKSARYGLSLSGQSGMHIERRTILCLIATCTAWLLWCIGTIMRGSEIFRHLKVNSSSRRESYSVLFLARLVMTRRRVQISQRQITATLQRKNRSCCLSELG